VAPPDRGRGRAHAPQLAPHVPVRCAYLELCSPICRRPWPNWWRRATRSRMLPMFLGTGRHAREDLPALVASPGGSHPAAHD
jgi:sirohydrochlorin cobaltochelatase